MTTTETSGVTALTPGTRPPAAPSPAAGGRPHVVIRRPHPIVAQLKAERERRGLTLRDVFDRCGIPPATVSAWETGGRSPNLRSLEVYAQSLGRTLVSAVTHPASSKEGTR